MSKKMSIAQGPAAVTRVLLVDQDRAATVTTSVVLSLKSCQVTIAASGYAAMQIISEGKKQFDVVIADVDLPDMSGYQLCAALRTRFPVLLTCVRQGADQVQRSVESGAASLIQKPADQFIVKYLPQLISSSAHQIRMTATDIPAKYEDIPAPAIPRGKKPYIKWTKELKKKFTDAVAQLDNPSCTPNKILEKMGVPGLTRMQVASYLQKYREQKENEKRSGNGQSSQDV